MKSFIGLALIAVLCAVELSQAAAPTANTLKVTDKNHLVIADRETEFICEFTTTETVSKVGIYKDGVGLPIIEVTSAGTAFKAIEGKIKTATYTAANVDFKKATFSVKKADAPELNGNYFCKVTIDQDYSSPQVIVYAESEIATLALTVKDPVDSKKPTEFVNDGKLEGSCLAAIPAGETLTKMEILNKEVVIASGDKDLTFTYPKPEGFPDGAVDAKVDATDKHKATITITKLGDKSGGDFKCRYTVEDGSTPKVTKADITSNVIGLTHVNGAAANVASLGLLVLAVTSYIKLSL